MNIIFHPAAEAEQEAAAIWYESKKPRLGAEFREEVENTLDRILAAPDSFICIENDIRSLTIHRFPYRVLYKVYPDFIFICAVMHLHRDPDYWKSRV